MGKRGPKKIPTVLKELHGNPGKRPIPVDEPEGIGDLSAPPAWFDDEQRQQWHYAIDHAPPGLLTGTDREVLAIWCVACVEHARAAQEVRNLGQVVKTKDGYAIQNPYLPIVNRQALIMLKAGSEMGFSPAARASLDGAASEFGDGPTAGRKGRLKSGTLAAYLEQKPDKLN